MAKKPQKAPMGQIRIIGGKWRGRKLPVLDSQGLRPTTDRVKETLFNWLMPVIQDARCLDCFAGSGGLGIEALSRYARETTFIEYERPVAQQITANLALLNADNGHVIQDSALSFLAKQGTPYNVVFLDPPFHKGMLSDTVQLLENNGWLAQDCYIYIEEEVKAQTYTLPIHWTLHREKIAGQVAYRLYIRSLSA
ncbi:MULTISPECIES: 16S rRNA (guanine(966)-N(2))-methyltransferase [Proteus]|uniref:Ribosomal RNA small subunit methyltransferase D n=1 Tax=Proteus penneri TaxID=102862 RepID=A0A0G4Q8S6_9GAMM|nr:MULTISPECIES: 16S rRNA (guanine(966)-N(2))-methyltransferase [Proteus]EEG84937.1 RNA methyltransferase, RsmD family [Proteus penneri ATCC 35198]MBJ2117827.1 16S rRNA (guanine(966)-N(2))-methyltransferase [Proteus penneri]MCO8052224.1 16S rRNA (guanine(966)-N(2))-methyltransferase [Proteus penneri]MCX2589597.1 16S rRNA (guanine(966)-N(2))-methyltransferase [Proteus penneri]NBL76001.1 16S rRNA (guanine(966)-N(2))-methyltransferase [Proteus sp. G2672]